MIRRLLELLSRNVVVRRRMPVRFGGTSILVSPGAALRFWRPSLERAVPELFRWAEALVKPGAHVWDVGANLGVFSIAASMRAGSPGGVVAVEPDPWLAKLIGRSVDSLPETHAPIELINAAVSDRDGSMDLIIGSRGRAANHLASVSGSSQASGERMRIKVATRSLDSLLAERRHPTLIKIDVEGAELLVLRGAKTVLSVVRPALLIEVTTATSEPIRELLNAAEYRLFDADERELNGPELTSPAWNTLAIPVESELVHR